MKTASYFSPRFQRKDMSDLQTTEVVSASAFGSGLPRYAALEVPAADLHFDGIALTDTLEPLTE